MNPAHMAKYRLALLILLLASIFPLPAKAAPLSGTRSIGPTGDYASITAAIADVQAQTLGGPLVLELQSDYVSTVETFPLTISALNGASATNTVTIRPASGATGLSITSAATTAATVDLNGAQYVTFDGRPGGVGSNAGSGVGTASQLTIRNSVTIGVAVRFINDASNNTLRYLTLQSVNTFPSLGTVVFGSTTGANGNDNNTLDHCDLSDGGITPLNGLYAQGNSTTAAQNNSGNTVSNCNICNFSSSSYSYPFTNATGVQLQGGNTDWNITGNSFYQTASRAAIPHFSESVIPIYIENSLGNNFTVTGNFIGGSAPGAGGTPWTATGGTSTYIFQGIRLAVGTTTPSSVHGNTIRNFIWTSSAAATTLPGVWSGIYVNAGSVNIGTVTGNTIGSGNGTDSISVTTSGDGGTSFGISSSSNGTLAIANNNIGSITVNGSFGFVSASLTGIQVTAGANTISNNVLGSTTTANSLNAANSSTSTTGQQVTGILSSSSLNASITGNTVANLNNNYAGTAAEGQIRGIVASAGVNAIIGNTARNLSTTSANNGLFSSQSVHGILDTSTTAGQTVSQNTVHSLANTTTSAAVNVTGIYFAGPTSGTNVIARNFVHSLAVSSSSAFSSLNGIGFGAGTLTAQNNMVRLGLDENGNSAAGAARVCGIFDNGTTAGRNFYHNSVYLGGTQTSGPAKTYAFDGSTGVSNARSYQNNIFVNARGQSGTATGKNYAAVYGGNTVPTLGLTASNNIFLASGTGGFLGRYNNVDYTTLTAWQTATGVESASLNADPLYVNPTGTAATVDLHIQSGSPAHGFGAPGTGVTNDFDGGTRSATTPDIGADEFGIVASTNASLTSIALSTGTLTPAFDTNTFSYTATVPNPNTNVTVFPVWADLTATVTVNGGGIIPVPLNVGANTVTILVTAQDGVTTKTYGVTITRQSVLETWRFTWFGITENTGSAANTADPYHTGVPNLAAFAVLGPGQDPARVATRLLPQPQIVGGNYVVILTEPAGVSGVTYGAEWSADLSTGNWTFISDTGTGGTHAFSVPIGVMPMIFMRLKVTPQ
ncbi:MAG: cadherin-like beta sandwich domain-containing protein [Chthoniobacteraceae bacterium]